MTSPTNDTYLTQYSAHTPMNGMNNGVAVSPALPSCINSSSCAITQYQAKNLYDAFYNDGLFDKSKGTLTIITGGYNVLTLGLDAAYTTATGSALPAGND